MFFDRPESGTRALIVHMEVGNSAGENLAEFQELTRSAGLDAVCSVTGVRKRPDPKYFIGTGKLEEIAAQIRIHEVQLTLFDHELTPTQERNLEQALNCRVMSRTALILEIFAQRARTHEGKLQVELAQLKHAATRLVRGWTHLDRQRGGSGRGQGAAVGLGGAGETQLEADQRLIGQRIKRINQRLEKVRKQRQQNRRSRTRADIRTVSLVGYTNAGKSTLFNGLCNSDVYVADQLFATLDPTFRKLPIAPIGNVILADTVGFISHLPHALIDAFRATLEEVQQADLLVHVVDASAVEIKTNIDRVNEVLNEINAGEVRQLLVYNKIDLIDMEPRIDRDDKGIPWRVWISARHHLGMDLFLQAIGEILAEDVIETSLTLEPSHGQLRADLYARGAVLNEHVNSNGDMQLRIRLEQKTLELALRNAGLKQIHGTGISLVLNK
ncbi:MAG: GTPase HflX [Gammaproteobacteria bacterium]|nr:GTPase HflX [Gammaproteobacteria bacterium]